MKPQVIQTTGQVSRFYYIFPLSLKNILYHPIRTLIITLLRNVMLTAPRELGLPVLTGVAINTMYPFSLRKKLKLTSVILVC